jgi:pSer/pThr/pTyr-binding forkhead associated (FHA) protein
MDSNGRQQGQPPVSNAQQAIHSRQPQPVAFNQKNRVLIEVDGKVIGARELNKPLLTIGRLSGNDVQVPSQRVSRLHAKIRWENGSWVIEDADSLNGLNFQGHRIERRILSPGDRVYLAPTAALHYEIMS